MHPTLAQIAVPFTIGYRPLCTGLGIIAGWLAVFLGLSFYARRWIGAKRWRNAAPRDDRRLGARRGPHARRGHRRRAAWLQAILLVTGPRRSSSCSSRVARVPGDPEARARRGRAATADAGRAEAPRSQRPRASCIAGGGLAAQRCAEALRQGGYEGPVHDRQRRDHAPYDRPPLSKDFLAGEQHAAELALRPAGWHAEQGVELVLGEPRAGLDPDARTLRRPPARASATSSSSSPPAAAPRAARGARGPRERPHAAHARRRRRACAPRCAPGRALAVLGAGLIGQEVAATARGRGADVDLVEAEPLPLGRALHPRARLAGSSTSSAPRASTSGSAPRVAALAATGDRLEALRLADGTTVELDELLVAIGVAAERRLAPRAARRAVAAPGDPRRGRRRRRRPLGARRAPGPRRRARRSSAASRGPRR